MIAASYPYLVIAGWSLLAALWATTGVGLILAAWRTWRPRASARDQHAAAAVAFAAAVALALATPLALTSIEHPRPWRPSDAHAAAGRAVPERASQTTLTAPSAQQPGTIARVPADALAATGAVVWLAGVVLLTFRLAGGWFIAQRIRRRAASLGDGSAHDQLEALRPRLNLTQPVALLQSGEVEAPVVIGWRRPALILPADVTAHLQPRMISALLAHEFAHIARRDYAVNVLQSSVEVLLFFSPAVIWMSRCIRETREYCCDDQAVVTCGDARHYVEALTTLASLGTVNAARPLMGAAGPRLITRVRRLLQAEAVPRFTSARLVTVAVLLAAVLVSGVSVIAAAASRTSRIAAVSRGSGQGAGAEAGGIPFGFISEQDGSGVDFHVIASSREAPLERASIRNLTNEPVAAVQFVAAVERFGRWPLAGRQPVGLFISEMQPLHVPPGQTVEISPEVVTTAQVEAVRDESPGAKVQLFFGLAAVRYANGFEWRITPNPAALTGSDVFGTSPPQVPRTLFARDASRSPAPYGACRDDRDRAYSHGAIVPVRAEPGRLARCDSGRWVESGAPR